jgi:nucleotide-binding universal stress UspA family protein
MKNIIVPLDFSADALKGLDLAVLFASKTPIKIQLVYVQRRTDVPSLSEEEYKYAEKHFKQILETYKNKIPKDSSLNYIIKKGKVYQEVVNQAQAFPDSMIIGSTHGASGFEELFIGSNAQRIISATTRPVITLRTPVVPKDIKKIILPIEFVAESRQKVVFTSLIAQIFSAEIDVLTVSSSKSKKIVSRLNAYSLQVCNYLKNRDIPYKTHSLIGAKYIKDVIEYAEKQKADLISIINESGESISDFIVGGVAQQMISKATMPVLTIKPKPHTIKESFNTLGE